MVDLELISGQQWNEVKDTILWLWLLFGCVVLFAGSMLTSRALIPSGLITHSLPDRARNLIPLFYATAALALIGVIVCLVMFIRAADVLYDIYGRVWI